MHIIVAALALGAAAIHVAAGPAHVEALGDLALGFYWVAIFQAAIGIGFLAAGASTPGRLPSRVALAGTLVITGLWIISRTIGIPLVESGAEPVGVADLVATVLQLGIIVLIWPVALATRPSAADLSGRRPYGRRGPAAGTVMAALGVIVLSSSIAVADAAAGHPHAASAADHGHGEVAP